MIQKKTQVQHNLLQSVSRSVAGLGAKKPSQTGCNGPVISLKAPSSSFNSDENDKDEQAKGEDPSQTAHNSLTVCMKLRSLRKQTVSCATSEE